MKLFSISNVYLSISLVSLYHCSGVLSMRLNGGGNSGVNYLHGGNILSEYYDNINSNKR